MMGIHYVLEYQKMKQNQDTRGNIHQYQVQQGVYQLMLTKKKLLFQ